MQNTTWTTKEMKMIKNNIGQQHIMFYDPFKKK